MTEPERVLADKLLGILPSKWLPVAGTPQLMAYLSEADILFFGGGAGGGKTDLLAGLAEEEHHRSIIFRREFPQLRGIIDRFTEIRGGTAGFNSQTGVWRLGDGRTLELASVPHEKNAWRFQGRPHDLKGFDEICHFTETQFRTIIGWNRTAKKGQRTRVVCTGNPPMQPEEEWVIRFWAPWLDPDHPNPAAPGELRWFVVIDGKDVEVDGPAPILHKGDELRPLSRTFIPARVDDNEFLMETGYKTTLQNLPEPLRTAMLKGVFGLQREDSRWQLIPTAWVDLAMERWKDTDRPEVPVTALGADIARGGKDKTVLAPRRGPNYFDQLIKVAGADTPDGPTAAALITQNRDPETVVNLDLIGVGGSAFDCLQGQDGVTVVAMVGSGSSSVRDRTGQLGMVNKRAEWWWALREALDPDHGIGLALPPDPELRADLAAPRWKLTPRGVQVEAKEDVIKRLGRSPDCGDAVAYGLADEGGGVFIFDDL